MTTPQPGWYHDEQNPGGLRWWDGAQWTDHRSAPQSAATYATAPPAAAPYSPTPYSSATLAPLKAPEGTNWNTVWIWLIVIIPLVPVLGLMTVDWAHLIDPNDRTGLSSMRFLFSPGYLIAMVGGWVGYALCVWFAYRDWAELAARGVPKPFHWAWTFLSSLVYIIGRSVVVRRRTGAGSAPLWAGILSLVVMLAIVVYIIAAMITGVINSVEQFGR